MKRRLLVFLLMIVMCNYFVLAASGNNISREAKASFNEQYPGALYAKWETMEDDHIDLVRFVFNNLAYVAYYQQDGTSIGFARIIPMESLPMKVKLVADNRLIGYIILSVQELVLQDRHLFYFEVVKEQHKKLICIYSDGKLKRRS